MVSTPSVMIHNGTHYFYRSAHVDAHENRNPVRSIINAAKSKASSLSKSLHLRSVLLIEAVRPYIKSMAAGLDTLKNYSIRVVICSTALIEETTKGLGLGLAVGTVSSFLLSPFPTIVVIVPTIQLAVTIAGGIGGFLYGVELAQDKWEQRLEKKRNN